MTSIPLKSPCPIPHAGPVLAVRRMFAQAFTYSGRASRSEFWWPTLLMGVGVLACDVAARHYDRSKHPEAYAQDLPGSTWWPTLHRPAPGESETEEQKANRARLELTNLAFTAPLALAVGPATISLSVRRLHDANLSGHWAWLNVVPLVGSLAGFALSALPSKPEGARFDPIDN